LLPLVKLPEQLHEWPGVELIKGEPASFVLPGLVELVVKPPGHLRMFVDEIDVGP
jgi:hypothetical protein